MQAGSLQDRRAAVDAYDFRDVHSNVRFGTVSARYGGWLGQIYPHEQYADQLKTNSKSVGGQSFTERKVPFESISEYFQHFEVAELDFTFYQPLLEEGDEPSSNYFVLSKYAEHAPDDASFLLKAPKRFFARSVRRNGQFVENPDFLQANPYLKSFHEPALEILGDRLDGVIFQQEYQRIGDSPSPEENVKQLDDFFAALPNDVQPHIELRSEHLLTEAYFDWLVEQGLGHVFSQWTWLPPIREQWAMTGEQLSAENGQVLARLLSLRDMKYAEAYELAHPFEEPVPELCTTDQAHDMVLDVTALAFQAASQNALLNVLAANRAWGNAPDLNRAIAHRILDEVEKRG